VAPRTLRTTILAGLLLVGVLSWTPGPTGPAVASEPEPDLRPNIVLIVADDLTTDMLATAMPQTKRLLMKPGLNLKRAFVHTSLCCPSRATILTGDLAHTTGVYTNEAEEGMGGLPAFVANGNEGRTFPLALHDAGYVTGLFGKYLNDYEDTTGFPVTWIPPGWDRWVAFHGDNGNYWSYELTVDGVSQLHGTDPTDYSTAVLGAAAESFIQERTPGGPFFLAFTPYGPHTAPLPGAPACTGPDLPIVGCDDGRFAEAPLPMSPAFNETDIEDKPAYLRSIPALTSSRIASMTAKWRRTLAHAAALDRWIQRLVEAVAANGELERTAFLFVSDNGYGWGDHRWMYKLVPYERSIKVPMALRFDGVVPARVERRFATNADIAPTLLGLAGVAPSHVMEGRDLAALFPGTPVPWRTSILLENLAYVEGQLPQVPTFCGLRTTRWKYVVNQSAAGNEPELYDLRADPHELQNLAGTVPDVEASLHRRLGLACQPEPPGFDLPAWPLTPPG
jgi:N-acetylglucosamine-6-sulfatase